MISGGGRRRGAGVALVVWEAPVMDVLGVALVVGTGVRCNGLLRCKTDGTCEGRGGKGEGG